jgi:hypothetical protein
MNYTQFFLYFLNQENPLFHEMKNSVSKISASRLSAVFGVSSFLSKNKLYLLMKEGHLEETATFSPAMQHGKDEERGSAEKFLRVYRDHYPSRHSWFTDEVGTGFWQKDPRFCASPDRILKWELNFNSTGIQKEGLELKNPYIKSIPQKVEPEMCAYVLQCVLNMEIFCVPFWHLFYYKSSTGEYSWFRIHRNQEFFETFIYHTVLEFLKTVEEGKPPKRMKSGVKKYISEFIVNSHVIDHMEYNAPERDD